MLLGMKKNAHIFQTKVTDKSLTNDCTIRQCFIYSLQDMIFCYKLILYYIVLSDFIRSNC